MIKQLPLSVNFRRKWDVRSQFAALCYRLRGDKVRVLLITSRKTGRWIVPKGWPTEGKTPAECAAIEAWEEAGVTGRSIDVCLGLFAYRKQFDDADDLPCIAMVYPLHVRKIADGFPEAAERKRKWVSRRKAAKMVSEPELARILRDFDPRPFH
jgi:8-oxo-dGTP pyrophosphatase MutT (NUDIX family)